MASRICIIEDDEGIQDILRIVLQKAGYETAVFSDAAAILAKNYSLPDLYLIDKQIPGFDGLNVCEFIKIHDDTKNIPVILMSAYPNVKELALNAGADAFIEKPFAVHLLLKVVQTQLQKHAAEHIVH